MSAPHKQDPVSLSEIRVAVTGLQRPECVLVTAKGDLFASDKRGGISHIRPDGSQTVIGKADIVPNGFVRLRDGSFLVANLVPPGGIHRLESDGRFHPYLTEIDGMPLSKF